MSVIMAIDPGNKASGYVVLNDKYELLGCGKEPNSVMAAMLKGNPGYYVDTYVIERVACYGMPVGREVFDTCEWIGRFIQIIEDHHRKQAEGLYRMDEKTTICHSAKANDRTIRRALIDRFAQHDLKHGKGTKRKPDYFFGFADDMWAAFAVGVTWLDKHREGR